MKKAYISYSRSDSEIVSEISSELQNFGVNVLLDTSTAISGEEFAMRIASNIRICDFLIFVVSETSLNSQWCRREVEFALQQHKRILPIVVQEKDMYLLSKSWLSDLQPLIWNSQGKERLISLLRENPPHSEPSATTSSSKCKSAPSRSRRILKYGCIVITIAVMIIIILGLIIILGNSSKPCQVPNYPTEISGNCAVEDPTLTFEEVSCDCAYAEPFDAECDEDIESSATIANNEIPQPPVASNEPYSQDEMNSYVDEETDAINEEAETKPVLPAINESPTIDNDEINKYEGLNEDEDSANSSVPLILVGIALLIIGCGFWLYTKKKICVKLVSNVDCDVFVDNEKFSSIKAKKVGIFTLPKGQYYITFKPTDSKIEEKNISLSVKQNGELINMIFPLTKNMKNKEIKCFIAGSTKLEAERNALRSGIAQTHNSWRKKNFEILSFTYEDFERNVVEGGPQNKYDEFIENEATIAVFIISGDIGQFTAIEFGKAMDALKKGKHPQILVFNDVNAPLHEYSEKLKLMVSEENQYWVDYSSLKELRLQFMHTLDWMLINMYYGNE